MKTFAESQNEQPFDWNRFLSKKSYSEQELIDAVHRSKSWTTCACGNQCFIIPRNSSDHNRPVDDKLKILGVEFYEAIKYMLTSIDQPDLLKEYHESAKDALAQIELRSSILIKREIKNRIDLLNSTILELKEFNINYTLKKS